MAALLENLRGPVFNIKGFLIYYVLNIDVQILPLERLSNSK